MPDFAELLALLNNPDISVPLAFSLLTGAIIGGERELQGKPAGLRTHMLVCLASTLLMLVAVRQSEWTLAQIPGTDIIADLTRMPHGILTGIGFLGAGVILRDGGSVHGLTTAASLWITSALGIVYGVGMVGLGVIGSVAALLVLAVLRLAQSVLPARNPLRLTVSISNNATFSATELEALLHRHGLAVRSLSWKQHKDDGQREIGVAAYSRSARHHLEALARDLDGIEAISGYVLRPLDSPTDKS
jgi:putative Mg2+ transporter-C (MgtC) family protein